MTAMTRTDPRIDCDVHTSYPTVADLRPYLTARWNEFIDRSSFTGSMAASNAYPPGVALSAGQFNGPKPPDAAQWLDAVRRDVLDRRAIDIAILSCYYGVEAIRHPDLGAALATAVNRWLNDQWLAREPRLRASLVVQPLSPDVAAEEVRRAPEGFVQVLLPVRSEVPYGSRAYDPFFQAAVERGLVVGLHFGGMTGGPPTSVGWPAHYFEDYVSSTPFAAQITSIVTEGLFERFPTLRIALLESGWAWLPHLLWRLDKEWKGLRREVPWVRKRPSEYVLDRMRASIMPADVPLDASVQKVHDQLGSPSFLMFASDYPHGHAAQVDDVVSALPAEAAAAVFGSTPSAFYDFA